jgi:hypothetical protein
MAPFGATTKRRGAQNRAYAGRRGTTPIGVKV